MPLDQAITDARSISGAAGAFLRAVRSGGSNFERAAERLERQAAVVVTNSVARFDSNEQTQLSDEELLADSLSQFSIGLTLVAAESAASDAVGTDQLDAAIANLDSTADALEAGGSEDSGVRAFDTHPNGERLGVIDAALAALDEMAETAATVVNSLLNRALRPLIELLPEDLRNALARLNGDLPGRFVKWGLRAVRRGLDMLLSLVELPAVEGVRDGINQVLGRLGQSSDAAVLAGRAIGVDDVRESFSTAPATLASAENEDLVAKLADLANRYSSLCKLLKRIAVIITSLAAALALIHVALPYSVAVTTAGLGLVLGALIVLGRDYTGANDLPGRIHGVRLLVVGSNHDAA
jgi:hypothetical protein